MALCDHQLLYISHKSFEKIRIITKKIAKKKVNFQILKWPLMAFEGQPLFYENLSLHIVNIHRNIFKIC